MGQRLVINIKKKGEDKILANCYYHWSAYTQPSLRLVEDIISNSYTILSNKKDTDKIKAIELLQSVGSGLEEEEYNTLESEEKKYCRIGRDRNVGLICITEKGIEDNLMYGEEFVTIEFDFDNVSLFNENITIDFGVYWVTTKENFLEEEKDIKIEDLVEFDFNLYNMNHKNIIELYNKIDYIENNCSGKFRMKGDKERIYCSIY